MPNEAPFSHRWRKCTRRVAQNCILRNLKAERRLAASEQNHTLHSPGILQHLAARLPVRIRVAFVYVLRKEPRDCLA